MTERPKRDPNKPWAPIENPQPGDLVRVKHISGTKLASKHKPVWAVVMRVWSYDIEVKCLGPYSESFPYATIHKEYAMPATKNIPDEVKVALVKYRLEQALKPRK